MILDTEVNTFDGYDEKNILDTLIGSDETMIASAVFMDTAQTMSANDLLPAGIYPIHEQKGDYVLLIDKRSNGDYSYIFNVGDHLWAQWKNDVKVERERIEMSNSTRIEAQYIVPKWALILLAVTEDVHPDINEAAFEKKLYEKFPESWIKPRQSSFII